MEENGLLWVKGKPGAGKSTLMAFIYKDFEVNASLKFHSSLDFFFHARGTLLQKTPIGMFRSLLHQLYVQIPMIRERIKHAFRGKTHVVGNHWDWQIKELKDLFSNAVVDAAKLRKLNIFVDALDEAGAEAANDLADYFHRLNDALHDAKTTSRICISCRHFPIIARVCSLEILVEKNNHDDILTYVHSEIQDKVQMETPEEVTSWSEVEDDVVNKASGVFQWVSLIVPLIIRYHGEGQSFAYIREKLNKVPRELGDVYEYVLTNIIEPQNLERTLLLMQWICFAERPLSVTELRYAINSDPTVDCLQSEVCNNLRDFVENDTSMVRQIKALSGGLAEVNRHENETTVQCVHQSVDDFLRSTGLKFLFSAIRDTEENTALSDEDIIGQSQNRLSRSCINYLILDEVLHCDLNMDRSTMVVKLPFIDYATRLWPRHAGKAESHGFSQLDLVLQFESHPQHAFPNWLQLFEHIDKYSDECPASGSTLLHIASRSSLRITLQALLKMGRYVDERNDEGYAALHYAAKSDHREIVNMLLDGGADVNAKSKEYVTPLMSASLEGHIEIATLLLDRGASLNENSQESGTAFYNAALNGNVKLV